jgi:large repetitive protein
MRRFLFALSITAAACGGKTASDPADASPPGGADAAADAPQGTPDGAADARPDGSTVTPDAMVSGVVQCPTPIAAPASGTCEAVAGTGTAVLLLGNVLGDGVVYKDGGVLYDGDKITYVGCDYDSAAGASTAARVSCGGAVISPGLINAHDHLNYDDQWPVAATTMRYDHRHEWRKGQNGKPKISTPTNKFGIAATSNGMRWNELRQAMNGTTSMAASTSATGMVRNIDEPSAADTTQGLKGLLYEVFMLGDSGGTLKPNCTWAYDKSEVEVANQHGMVTHTSEGINDYAHQEFLCQSQSFGGGRDLTEKNVAHIHAIGLTAADYYTIAQRHSKMIWSPRSNISLYGNTAEPQVLARLGGTIAIGTDWTYSGSATIVRELSCAAQWSDKQLGGAFTDEDLWRMATINGAAATGTEDTLGSLAAGKLADIAIFAAAPGQLHRAVIDATTDKVALVLRGGKPLSGEAAVVSVLDASCEAVSVCGKAFSVCATREFAGTTFATISAAVNASATPTDNAYPAVFCDAPAMEPTCAPSRPGEYGGPTATDADGDGVADASDDCANVFNPIRPMDAGKQSDVDGDGVGDACDPTPVGDDLDGDTVPNAMDNCPAVANLDQADTDGDKKGDACDPCPTQANPDSICPPKYASIVDVQNGTITAGTAVVIADAIVTGIDAKGFTIQDPTVADGKYAGVYAFVNAKPTVAIGDKVTVSGTVSEFHDNTELNGAAVTAKVAGTPITPIAVTAAQAADEAYENVLVTITDINAVVNPYSCTNDDPTTTCADALLWQVNSAANTPVIVYNGMYTGTTTEWSAEATAAGTHPSVTGVTFFRFNKRRILPRTAADITPGT